jgi:transposase
MPGCDVVADRGYDRDAVLNFIHQAGARAHIPSLSRSPVRRSAVFAVYRQPNLVERFFTKLKPSGVSRHASTCWLSTISPACSLPQGYDAGL